MDVMSKSMRDKILSLPTEKRDSLLKSLGTSLEDLLSLTSTVGKVEREKNGLQTNQSPHSKSESKTHFEHRILTCRLCGWEKEEYWRVVRLKVSDSIKRWTDKQSTQVGQLPPLYIRVRMTIATCPSCQERLLSLDKTELVERLINLQKYKHLINEDLH